MPEYKPKVDQLCKERWGEDGVDADNELAERCSIAKELFEGESEEVKECVVAAAREDYEAAVRRYEGNANAIENPDATSIELCAIYVPSHPHPD